jgi:hypothetical protein
MKTRKYFKWMFLAALTSVYLTACSDGTDDIEPPVIDPEEVAAHFDVWVSIGANSGMASNNTQLVKSLESLDEQALIDFKNSGADVTAKLYQESIIQGKFYYQIPKEKDRFGKYQIVNDQIVTVAEFPFASNTLKDRRYTHAWIDENTLVLIGSNGESDQILWIKINTAEMKIISEGTLDLPAPPQGDKFNTSGIASYREDGKILYSFVYSNTKTHFYMAFIQASTMAVEKVVEEKRAETMAGTAYGELLQRKTFFTPNGDYYIACNNVLAGATSSTQQYGALLRIKKGATTFDSSYRGYNYPKGKLVTVDCLSDEKVLLYIQDPEHTGASGWGSTYNCYYALLDLTTDRVEELKYEGNLLPYSSGTFSQRSIVMNGKAYIGVNPEKEAAGIFIYDIKTGEVTKGLTITQGYEFDRIVALLD